MNWQIKISNIVRKNLKKFPEKDKEKIKTALEEMIFNPYSGDVEKMKDEMNSWRRRVGSYRIFFDINKEEKIISVTYIKRRTSNTY